MGDERARGVRLADGAVLDADLVVVTTGVRPNSYLARRAGLKVHQVYDQESDGDFSGWIEKRPECSDLLDQLAQVAG